jgi:phage gp29-like protein
MIDPSTAERIDIAAKYIEEAEALQRRAEDVLDPIVQKVMEGTMGEMEEMLNRLPRGFHRAELRTYINMRKAGTSD